MRRWPNHYIRFGSQCRKCGDWFFLVSDKRRVWLGGLFELEVANHQIDCVTIAVLNAVGIKAERNDG